MATSFKQLGLAAVLAVLASDQAFTDAFGLATPTRCVFTAPSSTYSRHAKSQSRLVLNAEEVEGGASNEEAEEAAGVEAELTDDEPASPAEAEEEVPEDPEVTAIKAEIAELESTLKQKNRDLGQLENLAEDYSKSGYARKVAEMEGFRRLRSAASKNNKQANVATVLQSFLPVLDKLKSLDINYAGDEFAKKYSALGWDFANALKDLGVTEFTAIEGENLEPGRFNAVQEEYSETIPRGCVILPIRVGYELEGNVMRLADAVVSLGTEAEAQAAAEAAEAEEESTEAAEESTSE